MHLSLSLLSLPPYSLLLVLSLRLLCAGPSAVLGPLSLSSGCLCLIPDVSDLDLRPPVDSASLSPVCMLSLSLPLWVLFSPISVNSVLEFCLLCAAWLWSYLFGNTWSCSTSSQIPIVHICLIYLWLCHPDGPYSNFTMLVYAVHTTSIACLSVLGEGSLLSCSSWGFFHFFPVKGFFGGVFPYPIRGSKDRGCRMLYRL